MAEAINLLTVRPIVSDSKQIRNISTEFEIIYMEATLLPGGGTGIGLFVGAGGLVVIFYLCFVKLTVNVQKQFSK